MVTKSVSALALFAASVAAQAGSFVVQNSCEDTNIYYWIVQAQGNNNPDYQAGPFQVTAGSNGSAHEYIPLENGGVSVQFNTEETQVGAQLLEYTYTTGQDTLWYDLSDIDGTPFSEGGFAVIPADNADETGQNCRTFTCCAGVTCPWVYNVWNDDTKSGQDNPMANCALATDLAFVLCPGKAGGSTEELYNQQQCKIGDSGPSSSVSASSAASPSSSSVSSTYSSKVAPTSSAPTSWAVPTTTLATSAPKATATHTTPEAVAVAAPAPAPAAEAAAGVDYAIEIVTEIQTVTEYGKRNAAPTPVADRIKRHLHRHVHAHGDF